MTTAKVLRLLCAFSFCWNAFGADPLELRLWPGKAPGSENWTVPESISVRGKSLFKQQLVLSFHSFSTLRT